MSYQILRDLAMLVFVAVAHRNYVFDSNKRLRSERPEANVPSWRSDEFSQLGIWIQSMLELYSLDDQLPNVTNISRRGGMTEPATWGWHAYIPVIQVCHRVMGLKSGGPGIYTMPEMRNLRSITEYTWQEFRIVKLEVICRAHSDPCGCACLGLPIISPSVLGARTTMTSWGPRVLSCNQIASCMVALIIGVKDS